MFIRLQPVDIAYIWRGFLLVLAVIIIGVAAAESQINNLTQKQEFAKAFNITQNRGIYSAYLLGYDYSTSFLYPVGRIYNNEQEIIVQAKDFKLVVPIRIQVELSKTMALDDEGRRQFINEGMKTKQSFGEYLKLLAEKIGISL